MHPCIGARSKEGVTAGHGWGTLFQKIYGLRKILPSLVDKERYRIHKALSKRLLRKLGRRSRSIWAMKCQARLACFDFSSLGQNLDGAWKNAVQF